MIRFEYICDDNDDTFAKRIVVETDAAGIEGVTNAFRQFLLGMTFHSDTVEGAVGEFDA